MIFLPKHSTTSQLFESLQNLNYDSDSGTPTDVIHIDFRKGFDSISHIKLTQNYMLECFAITQLI